MRLLDRMLALIGLRRIRKQHQVHVRFTPASPETLHDFSKMLEAMRSHRLP